MARRKTGNGAGVAILLLLAALAAIGPFLIAGWSIFTELRARKYRGASRASEVLTSEERAAYERMQLRIATLEAAQQRILARGDAAGLARRLKDDLFDARSTLGRQLNRELEGLSFEASRLEAEFAPTRRQLEQRMERWFRARASLVGSRAGLVTFVVVFVGAFAAMAQGPVNAVTLMFGSPVDAGARLAASGLATAIAGVVLWVAGSQARASLAA